MSPGRERYPALDGARALAAMGVLITHVGLLSGYITRTPSVGPYLARLDLGVTIFFMLSGFLLYRPFVVARLAGLPQGDVATYARRRILRILPAYWVALTIIAFVLRAPAFEEPHSIISHYLLLHVYDLDQLVGGPIQQAWTLSTEVAFYVFVPLWAWLMARPRRAGSAQVRLEVWALGALFIGSTLANLALVGVGVSDSRFAQLGTWLPFRIGDFVPGMLLAVVTAWVAQHGLRLPRWMTGAGFAVGCWIGALFTFWVVSTRLDLPMFPIFTPAQAFTVRILYLIVAVLVVAPAVLSARRSSLVRTLLANPIAVWLGLISYGIYIWHEAFQDLYLRWTGQPALFASFTGMMVVTVVASVIAGAASWYVIERPAMRRAARPPRSVSRAAGRNEASPTR